MIIAWAGLGVVVGIVVFATPAQRIISTAVWPREAPVNLHDNRARDPHLRHLARILDSESTAEAQRTIAGLREGMVTSSMLAVMEGDALVRGRLGGAVSSFIDQPPARDHATFLRELGAALEEIERL